MNLFRRNTHTRIAGANREKAMSRTEAKLAFARYGHVVHAMSSNRPVTLDEIHAAIKADTTNYRNPAEPPDGSLDTRSPWPTRGELAEAVCALVEAGVVEVIKKQQWAAIARYKRDVMLGRVRRGSRVPALEAR